MILSTIKLVDVADCVHGESEDRHVLKLLGLVRISYLLVAMGTTSCTGYWLNT